MEDIGGCVKGGVADCFIWIGIFEKLKLLKNKIYQQICEKRYIDNGASYNVVLKMWFIMLQLSWQHLYIMNISCKASPPVQRVHLVLWTDV